MFTPGATTLSGPFRGLPGWRRTSWLGRGARLEALNPTVIFSRGYGAKTGRGKPPHCPQAAARKGKKTILFIVLRLLIFIFKVI